MPSRSMLEAKGLGLIYGERILFKNLSMALNPKFVYGIIGESGVGKTSLLHVLSGNIDPTSGFVSLDHKVFPKISQRLIPGLPEIGFVSAQFNLDWNHSCRENIRESILSWPNKERESRVDKILKLMELDKVQRTLAKDLSSGEQQRLAIARAVACNLRWLMLDEPFGHLDAKRKSKLCELIQKLHRSEGVGILLVSQQMEDIYRLTDYFSTLKSNGRLTKFQRPEMAYFKLTSPAEAKRFGWLNEVEWQGQHYYFRPNQYEITANGIPLEVVRVVFNGYIFEHFCRFENQEVILYALNHLPQEFKILPTVV